MQIHIEKYTATGICFCYRIMKDAHKNISIHCELHVLILQNFEHICTAVLLSRLLPCHKLEIHVLYMRPNIVV